jgi:beta-glucosidase
VQYSEGVDVGYRWYDANGLTPLFPFGFGLSYTTFSYSNLHIGSLTAGGQATVTATVTNTGTRAGADVAQLYVTDPAASGQPPLALEGFQRVSLAAGASSTVTFPLSQQNLQYWNSSSNTWATSTGGYTISVGDSSANLPLTGTLAVAANQLGQPVTLANPGPQENVIGAAASVALSGSDSTSGQTLAYSATGLPAGTAINAGTGAITGTATTAGTGTVTVTAKDGNGAQASVSFVWTVAPGTSGPGGGTGATGAITGYQGLCLDVRSASNVDGTPVQVYTCNGTNAQQWTAGTDGTVRALGKCLDVSGAGTTNGTKVQLYTCNGTGAQQWQAQSDGELINTNSGSCLDDTGYGGSGTQVQIWACGDTSNQQWQLP